jgi:hypothetical protein
LLALLNDFWPTAFVRSLLNDSKVADAARQNELKLEIHREKAGAEQVKRQKTGRIQSKV